MPDTTPKDPSPKDASLKDLSQGEDANPQSGQDVKDLEEAQKDAAEEREEEGGYQ